MKNKNKRSVMIEYKGLLKKAKELKKGKILFKTLGICHNVACKQDKSKFIPYSSIIYRIFQSWDKFSGNKNFPIPHPTLNPKKAFLEIKNLWDKRTQYGKNRWEALDYLIKELKKINRGIQ